MWHLIVKVRAALEVLLRALYEEQNVGQRAYGILVASHHHVRKADIVARSHVTCWNMSVHWLQCTTQ